MVAQLLVSIVDDDDSVRESLPDLLAARGYNVEAFVSAEEFLASSAVERTSCLILDVSMPGMTGPELQDVLNKQRRPIPIIFITALPDEALFARLVSRGGVGCLTKPFSDQELRRVLDAALTE
ncbi:response regulator transcription factor [Bradyrhizobium sp. USDA 4473]